MNMKIVKTKFYTLGDLEHEAVVNGRRVGVFRLKKPIIYRSNTITAIELLEPKDGQLCIQGWEHAEFMIDDTFEELIAKYPNLNWDTISMNRPIYAHLKLKLSDNMQVKFNRLDVLSAVELDKKTIKIRSKII